MDNYPQNLVNQYLKASNKLKKFERVVFKRFAPNVAEVLDEFSRLAVKFEASGIYQYAAMCHLGGAKCEMAQSNGVGEVQAYLRAARSFKQAHNTSATLQLRSNRGEFIEGALRCYSQALERTIDDSVMKAAIIREMTQLQPHTDVTSTFASAAHRIYEMELAANAALKRYDFFAALQQLDDIVDNVMERKKTDLYSDLLQRVEVLRLLLLMLLNLPPARQSPSHIKLLQFYIMLGDFGLLEEDEFGAGSNHNAAYCAGDFVQSQMKYALAEAVVAWHERKYNDLTLYFEQFLLDFKSLSENQRFVIRYICESAKKFC